jgi:hypothetical protein
MTHTQEHGGASACQDERRPFGVTESTYGEPYIWAAGEEMTIEKAEKLAAELGSSIIAARDCGRQCRAPSGSSSRGLDEFAISDMAVETPEPD